VKAKHSFRASIARAGLDSLMAERRRQGRGVMLAALKADGLPPPSGLADEDTPAPSFKPPTSCRDVLPLLSLDKTAAPARVVCGPLAPIARLDVLSGHQLVF